MADNKQQLADELSRLAGRQAIRRDPLTKEKEAQKDEHQRIADVVKKQAQETMRSLGLA